MGAGLGWEFGRGIEKRFTIDGVFDCVDLRLMNQNYEAIINAHF